MINKVETGFYLSINKKEKLYNIVSPKNGYIGTIFRKYKYKFNNYTNDMMLMIEYELELSAMKKFDTKQRGEINLLFHNIVNVLTYDINHLFGDEINERLNIPFYKEKYRLENA